MTKMRTNLIICIIIALSLILCPVKAVANSKKSLKSDEKSVVKSEERVSDGNEYISVMAASNGKIEKIELREYVIGSVAAEMNALYHSEALKAQAVASYTYAKKIREENEKHKEASLEDADITDSPDSHQGYIDREERKEKWGDDFEKYEEKIEAAVNEVFGTYLTYNGETALTVYHCVSAGRTQSAESLWGSDIPYLISVESPGDRLSPDYSQKKNFSDSRFKELAAECGAKLEGEADDWVKETVKDEESGYVSAVKLGTKTVSAATFRNVFELRSLCFEISHSDNGFTVVCLGYGHGAGMSQYGADYMARQGSSWREILNHYYPGTEIVS